MTSAYDYALPKTTAASLRAVHIAPASPSTRGFHSLADLDLVINGLRLIGPVPAITESMPGYLLRGPGYNLQTDFLGHGILEIYFNETLAMDAKITAAVKDAFNTMQKPANNRATSGFFTVTMTWDGAGDVDLHTIEPNGAHVYYANSIGSAGRLDVDNTVALGPEHYFASCDLKDLQVGTFQFGVNNYSGATGRTATFQVASNQGGVLTSSQVSVGAERGSSGDSSPTPVVKVVVSKGPIPPVTSPPTPQSYVIAIQ